MSAQRCAASARSVVQVASWMLTSPATASSVLRASWRPSRRGSSPAASASRQRAACWAMSPLKPRRPGVGGEPGQAASVVGASEMDAVVAQEDSEPVRPVGPAGQVARRRGGDLDPLAQAAELAGQLAAEFCGELGAQPRQSAGRHRIAHTVPGRWPPIRTGRPRHHSQRPLSPRRPLSGPARTAAAPGSEPLPW
jgi:hypothetical protein